MKMYGGDWLTNAALIGYIRIQRNSGMNLAITDGHLKITHKDLESFADRYFNAVLEQYMKNSFVLNKESRTKIIEKLNVEQKKTFKKDLDIFSKKYQKPLKLDYDSFEKSSSEQVILLKKYQKDLKKFLNDVEKKFKITKTIITSILKKNNEKIEKKIDAINNKHYKFIPNSLKRFYFNKKIIGNHAISKKSSRFDEFNESFVKPALLLLECNKSEGHVTCKLCKQNKINLSSFNDGLLSEGMFSSTMVSNTAFKNFFYNCQSDLFICKVCELLLLCTWAGFNLIPLNARDDVIKTDYIFVNTSDLQTTLKQNDGIKQHDMKNDYSFKETIYKTVFKNILLQQQTLRSQWIIDSCFFVELKTVNEKRRGKPDFRYFHVGKNIAKLFTHTSIATAFASITNTSLTINSKTKIHLSNTIIDKILSSEPLTEILYKICKDHIVTSQNLTKQLFNTCLISAIRSGINEEFDGDSMNQNTEFDSKKVYGILMGYQKSGYSLATRLGRNKIKSFSYVLLEAIRNNNMNKFFDILIKLYITNNMPVPDIMISLLNKQDAITTSEKSYAFMSGFCSIVQEVSDE